MRFSFFLLSSAVTAFIPISYGPLCVTHHCQSILIPTKSTTKDDGWFDDYDDFVQQLDFNNWDATTKAPLEPTTSRRERSDYRRDPNDSSMVSESVVNELLSQRTRFRKQGRFEEADGIREKLMRDHGVTVWDKDRMWTAELQEKGGRSSGRRVGGRGRDTRGRAAGRGRGRQLNQYGHDYTQTGGPIDPIVCSLSEREIHLLIRERMECKFARDYQMADSIERELLSYGVHVHDGFKEWRADGEGFARNGNRDREADRGPRLPKVYAQRGQGQGLSEEDVRSISSLVEERAAAKVMGQYDRADEIFEKLANNYNVNVDDKRAEWSLIHEEYILGSDTAFVPDENIQKIVGKKLGERILARKNRDFDLADEIRQELLQSYLVEIHDKKKEWWVAQPNGAKWVEGNEEEDEYDSLNVVTKDEFEIETNEEILEDLESITIEEDEIKNSNDHVGDDKGNSLKLSSLTVPQLKQKLRDAGLPVSGNKSELIDRLTLNSIL